MDSGGFWILIQFLPAERAEADYKGSVIVDHRNFQMPYQGSLISHELMFSLDRLRFSSDFFALMTIVVHSFLFGCQVGLLGQNIREREFCKGRQKRGTFCPKKD
jgi:hypothetical protein